MIPIRPEHREDLKQMFIERTGLGSDSYRITPRSPWPSELFALFAVGQEKGIRVWLESGTYHGQTATILAKSSPETEVTTIELNPAVAAVGKARLAKDAPNVRTLRGDGNVALRGLADTQTLPTGVFIDGPKGLSAVMLARSLLANYSNVSLVALHDMPQSASGHAVPARAALEEYGRWDPTCSFWATDDPDYVMWTKDMDDGLHEAHATEDHSGWRPYERIVKGHTTLKMRSYGPTIAFLFRGPRWLFK